MISKILRVRLVRFLIVFIFILWSGACVYSQLEPVNEDIKQADLGVKAHIEQIKERVTQKIASLRLPIVKSAEKKVKNLIAGLASEKLTEQRVVDIAKAQMDSLSEVIDIVMKPLIQFIKPLPIIPLAAIPPGIAEIPGVDIASLILAIPTAVINFQVGLNITGLELDYKALRHQFDSLTHNKYRTKAEMQKDKEKESRRKHRLLRNAAFIQRLELQMASLDKAIKRGMVPIEDLRKKFEQKADFLIRPIVELTTKIPLIPMLGALSLFHYIVYIRSIQQRIDRIKHLLENNLKSIRNKNGDAITLAEMKEQEGGAPFARELEKMMKPVQKVVKPIEDLMDPLETYPFFLATILMIPLKAASLVFTLGGRIAKYLGIITSPTGVGLGILAAGVGLSTAGNTVSQVLTQILWRAHIRNIQQMLDRLEKEIEKEQEVLLQAD